MWKSSYIILVCLVTTISSEQNQVREKHKREVSTTSAWGSWGEFSECSRTCGGGVSEQTRPCLRRRVGSRFFSVGEHWNCVGLFKKHKSCNPEPCPGDSKDFRQIQCEAFNDTPFMGRIYEWEPFLKAPNPCALNCRAKDFQFYVKLAEKVIDGTQCTPGSQEICVDGQCKEVGCDGVLGSAKKFDECGVCGGDNTECQIMSGIWMTVTMDVGYQMVVKIPRGATKINITELAKSRNYLAVKSASGIGYINSDWSINKPGRFSIAGTMFEYKRPLDPTASIGEQLLSDGPTIEELDVMLIYQTENSGVYYEFIMPSGREDTESELGDTVEGTGSDQPQPGFPAGGYYLQTNPRQLIRPAPGVTGGNGQRGSSIPGPYRQTGHGVENTGGNFGTNYNTGGRYPVNSGGRQSGNSGGRQTGSSGGRRTGNSGGGRTGNPGRGVFTGPSYPNYGLGTNPGIQLQPPYGTRYNSGIQPDIPSASNSRTVGLQPPYGVGSGAVLPRYQGAVNPPSVNPGIQTGANPGVQSGYRPRIPGVYPGVNTPPDGDVVSGGSHNPYQSGTSGVSVDESRPSQVKYMWRENGMTQCSQSCAGGTQHSLVQCLTENSLYVVADSNCNVRRKPRARTIACNTDPCPPRWETAQWGECSRTCDEGVQIRQVTCMQQLGRSVDTQVSAAKCVSLIPETTQKCLIKECPVWNTGKWTKCSVVCGHGVRTRKVTCEDPSGVVEDRLCIHMAKPADTEGCEMRSCAKDWYFSEWSDLCSEQCGPGVLTRHVFCAGHGEEDAVARTECFSNDDPNTPDHVTMVHCSSECGDGKQSRTVLCVNMRNADNYHVVSSGACQTSDKPSTTQFCNLKPCQAQWYKTQWTECTKTCDGGSRSREIKCLDEEGHHTQYCSDDNKPSTRESCNIMPCPTRLPDGACKDKFYNCNIVSQARLCQYSYYKKECCFSCYGR
uniref:LOW QUALITY PROTEIN: thrombospondin type-1 domain-containing protein 4-like n=1 Tax=Saccoglossus kowalevskii TaxID=10224 RepID=A0ABM0MT60_SACKO|nr:PREDICTED: LOW QUALITY PROTEIN: thrombospondin type-1 domain-containing protein 4-like [Saccoglossus kowalevskii]